MRGREPFFCFVDHRIAGATATACVVVALGAGCASSRGQGGPASMGGRSIERQSDAEYDLARDLFQKGNPRAALDHARKAVELNEDNDKAQYFVAVIHLSFCTSERGYQSPDCQLGDVEKYVRASLRANPDFRDAKNMLGAVLVSQKRCREAIAVLEPLTKDAAYVYPFFAWGNLGDAQLCAGQVDAAIASLKNAVAEPRFCVGHYRLGLAYERRGNLEAAEESFTRAVSADPSCEALQDAWGGRCRVRVARKAADAEWQSDCEKCRSLSVETPSGQACASLLKQARSSERVSRLSVAPRTSELAPAGSASADTFGMHASSYAHVQEQ